MIYQENIAAVDPGVNGGIAWRGTGEVQAARCPENNPRKLLILVRMVANEIGRSKGHVFIESQQATPIDTPKTAFALGGNFYMWWMAFEGFKVPITFRTGKQWQAKTGVKLPPGRENYSKRKALLKDYALRGFPGGLTVWEWKDDAYRSRLGKVTNANADAIAILRALGTRA